MITDIALFTALGLVLSAVGLDTWSAGWWCVVGLFFAYGWHKGSEGYDRGLDDSLTVINKLEQLIKQHKNKDTQ